MNKALPQILFLVTIIALVLLSAQHRIHHTFPTFETDSVLQNGLPLPSFPANPSTHFEDLAYTSDAIQQVTDRLIDLQKQQDIILKALNSGVKETSSGDASPQTVGPYRKNKIAIHNLSGQKQQFDAEVDTLKQKSDALQGQIDVYKKYNDELLKREAAEKEGAKKYELYMPMIITGFLGLVALGLLIWRKEDAHAEKWCFSTLGAILGYWLKGGAWP